MFFLVLIATDKTWPSTKPRSSDALQSLHYWPVVYIAVVALRSCTCSPNHLLCKWSGIFRLVQLSCTNIDLISVEFPILCGGLPSLENVYSLATEAYVHFGAFASGQFGHRGLCIPLLRICPWLFVFCFLQDNSDLCGGNVMHFVAVAT